MFKIFFVYISRKNNQKTQKMTRFTPHHPTVPEGMKIQKDYLVCFLKKVLDNNTKNMTKIVLFIYFKSKLTPDSLVSIVLFS